MIDGFEHITCAGEPKCSVGVSRVVMKKLRSDSNNKTILVALGLLIAVAPLMPQFEVRANTGGSAKATASAAPKTAPDRRLRMLRPGSATLDDGNSASGSAAPPDAKYGSNDFSADPTFTNAQNQNAQNQNGQSSPASSGATTVSLQGGVTRLDGNAASAGNQQQQQRAPLTGKIESLIDTPLQARKPQSESIPPQTFRAWLENAHPQFALSASSNPNNSVVVLKGQWDNSAKTLDKFQIPHVKMGGGKIEGFPLNETKVVIVDCAGNLPRSSHQKLREFVQRGGYLLSTDWALDNFTGPILVDRSQHEIIKWNKATNRRDVVDATVYDTDPVLFKNTVTNAYWKLDQDSHLIRVLNRDAVRILATSTQLAADDPDRAGILAVVYPYGRGYVMHMTGHFDNNAKIAIGNFLPDPAPVIKISLRQALAANFVVAGLTQTPIPTSHRR
mgnify:CR=1 FL=1